LTDDIVPFVPSEHVVVSVIGAALKSSNKTKFVFADAGVGDPVPQPKNPDELLFNR